MKQIESQIQRQVCEYLRLQLPEAIFRSDYASGLKLTIVQAAQHKRLQSSRAWPDLVIYERSHDGKYPLLALELKAPGVVIYKKDGTLRADKHLREQAAMLQALRDRGYAADFAIGFGDAVRKIDAYFGHEQANLFSEDPDF